MNRRFRTCFLIATTRFGLAALVVSAGAGCSTPRVDVATAPRQGHVYCLRGLMDVFSLGLNDLAADLRAAGVDAHALSGPQWGALASRLEDAAQAGKLEKPIAIVGHSYGADDAIRLARDLDNHGIPVELVVLLDATSPPQIPPNVRHCVHFYKPTWLGRALPDIFAGDPIDADQSTAMTVLENRPLDEATFGSWAGGVNHFNIEANERVRRMVVEEVISTLPERNPQSEARLATHAP